MKYLNYIHIKIPKYSHTLVLTMIIYQSIPQQFYAPSVSGFWTTCFLYKTFCKKMSLKNSKKLKKILRNFPGSNALALFLTFFSVFIINSSIILFSKHGNVKRWKHWLVSVKQLRKKRDKIKVKKISQPNFRHYVKKTEALITKDSLGTEF